jgi:hypothetical protein
MLELLSFISNCLVIWETSLVLALVFIAFFVEDGLRNLLGAQFAVLANFLV